MLPKNLLAEAARKHIPRYPLVNATLIGRLAVEGPAGQRLGAILVADALQRAFESASTVGSSMVVVDALNESVAGFCRGARVRAMARLAPAFGADAPRRRED